MTKTILLNRKFSFTLQKQHEDMIYAFVYQEHENKQSSCFISISKEEYENFDLHVNVKYKKNEEILAARSIDRALRSLLNKHKIKINIEVTLFDANYDDNYIFCAVLLILRHLLSISIGISHFINEEIDLIVGSTDKRLCALEVSCKNLSILRLNEYISECVQKNQQIIDTLNEIKSKFSIEEIATPINKLKRLDTRGNYDIRPITITNHVTGKIILFSRGNTSVLSSVNFGLLDEERSVNFEYNFSHNKKKANRREIGHGELIKNAFMFLLPAFASIYALSQVQGCDGSSSMASICGVSIALKNIGFDVPLISGLTVGKGKNYWIDITQQEDVISDMDFKYAGSKNGTTAIQADFKNPILIEEIEKILQLAFKHNKKILDTMQKNCFNNKEVFHQIDIPTNYVGLIIGSGGKKIKQISSITNSMIKINKTGKIIVKTSDLSKVMEFINFYTKKLEVNDKVAFFLKENMNEKKAMTSIGEIELTTKLRDLPKDTCLRGVYKGDNKIKILSQLA